MSVDFVDVGRTVRGSRGAGKLLNVRLTAGMKLAVIKTLKGSNVYAEKVEHVILVEPSKKSMT